MLCPASDIDWRFNSYMIVYMLECHSPNSILNLLIYQPHHIPINHAYHESFPRHLSLTRQRACSTNQGTHQCLEHCQFGSVRSLSHVRLFVTPWTAVCQAFLSITNSWSLLKLMSLESLMPSNHLILCHPLLLPPSIFPNIRVLSNESVLHIRWPKYWNFSFSISPSIEYSGLISFRMDWLECCISFRHIIK